MTRDRVEPLDVGVVGGQQTGALFGTHHDSWIDRPGSPNNPANRAAGLIHTEEADSYYRRRPREPFRIVGAGGPLARASLAPGAECERPVVLAHAHEPRGPADDGADTHEAGIASPPSVSCSIVSGRSVRNASVPGRIRGAKGRPAWHAGGVEAAGIRSFRRSSSTRYARPILAAELGRPRRALAIERDLAAARAQWWELLEEFTARAQELGVQRHT